jgi:hypothetical protein
VDGGGGEAEAGEHSPPVHSGGVCKDGSEACLSVTPQKAYCARDGVARETKPELAFSRYEVYEEKIRVYRPKGLQAYTTTAKEHVKLFYFTCIKKPPCGLASFRGLGLLARLAKVVVMTVSSVRNAAGDMNATARKRKTLAPVSGPPRKLRFFSIQYIDYEPPPRR